MNGECLFFDPKELQADIVIGIRSYEVLFEGSTMHGKQADLHSKALELHFFLMA